MGNNSSTTVDLKLGKKKSKLIESLNDLGNSPQIPHMAFMSKAKVKRSEVKRRNISSKNVNQDKSEQNHLNMILSKNLELVDFDMIKNCFESNFFLKNLSQNIQKETIKNMTLCSIAKGSRLFEQGSTGKFFYVVAEGTFELEINGKAVKTFERGVCFGDLALLHDDVRSGTVTSLTPSKVWCLSRNNFKKVVDYFNKNNLAGSMTFVNSVEILSTAPDDIKRMVSSKVIKESFSKGEIVFKEGDRSNCFYLVESGWVQCLKDDKVVRTIKPGETFGLLSVLADGFRSLTVVSGEDTVLYSLSYEVLQQIMGQSYKEALLRHYIHHYVAKTPLFASYSKRMIDNVLDNLQVEWFAGNELVIEKTQEAFERVVFVIEGAVSTKDKIEIASKGQILFSDNIFNSKEVKLKENLFAFPDCLIASIKIKTLETIGATVGDAKRRSSISTRESSLENVRMFKMLGSQKLFELATVVEKKIYFPEELILTQGEAGSSMFFIADGEVEASVDGKYVRTLTKGSYFGERCLFLKEPRSASVKATSEVVAYELSKEALEKIFSIGQIDFFIERIHLQDDSIQLEDLLVVSKLGEGSYGKVYKVEHQKSRFNYALKMISADQVNMENLHENIELERKLLLQLDHPFVVKLVKTMKQDNFLFFLMERIQGEDLFTTIRVIGLLDKYQTQFYSASLLLMVRYLREQKIIFRDFKPENVMVGSNGYCKLIDFGTATQCKDRTFTIIGTPHYMAPEMLQGKGYSFSADMWAVGVCMYEFLCGNLPFAESATDPKKVYTAVLNEDLKYPKFVKDEKFRHLIRKMLTKSQLKRLVRFEDIVDHPWFDDFSFAKLEEFKTAIPYLPKEKKSKSVLNVPVEKIMYSGVFAENLEGYSEKHIAKGREKYQKWFDLF